MKTFITNSGRLLALNVLFFSFFALSGGHLHVLWQPYQILMIVGSVLIHRGFSEQRFKSPQNVQAVDRAVLDFRRSIVLGGGGAFLLSLIIAFQDLPQDLATVGYTLAATLAAPYWALILYCSYRPQVQKNIQ